MIKQMRPKPAIPVFPRKTREVECLRRFAQRGLQAVRWPKPVEGEHSMASLGKPKWMLFGDGERCT